MKLRNEFLNAKCVHPRVANVPSMKSVYEAAGRRLSCSDLSWEFSKLRLQKLTAFWSSPIDTMKKALRSAVPMASANFASSLMFRLIGYSTVRPLG